jgi:hypothetical protein
MYIGCFGIGILVLDMSRGLYVTAFLGHFVQVPKNTLHHGKELLDLITRPLVYLSLKLDL